TGGRGRPRAGGGKRPKGPGRSLLGADECLVVIAADDRVYALARDVVRDLAWRPLHEVGGRRHEGALQPAVEPELEAADRVGDHPGRVGRVPHLELQFGVEWHVPASRALHPDVAPLAVL